MKRFLFMTLVSLFLLPIASFGQSQAELLREQKKVGRYTESQLKERASKTARKEAKRLEKEGWLVTPGTLPLEKQLDRSYNLQYQFDEDLAPKYIFAEAQSIGENYDAAVMQATELAKQLIAGQIETNITAIIENTVANEQMSKEQAASITRTISASKNIISQKLGAVVPVVKCYRVKSNKNKEVLVHLAYNTENAIKAAKAVIKEELEKKGEDLHNQLDKVLGF